MAVRDFKKFFKRRSRFVRQPQNEKKTFQRSRDDKNTKVIDNDLDADVAIDHVKQKAKADPLDYFKGMSYDDIRPIFEDKFNSNIEFLLKSKEQIEEEENRAIQKATPLARKVSVMDYEIIHFNNKPHYKIIRADGTHQLYLILLVERRYPLLRFTLDQMMNAVRLRVEEQSEMSLELLSVGVDAVMDLEENTKCLMLLGQGLTELYGDDTLEELTATVIMMARIQLADDNFASEPSYDAKAVSKVNASIRVHEHVNRVKCKTIIHTSDDDQIDSNIIFNNPYVENNGGTSEHDLTAHDEYHDIKMLAYNFQRDV
nr:zf-CCHC domain-containing protein/DUF4219 domain-containing protein/UBN2 domain-containing protein [Tanacetum cinerariifolium]